VKSLILSQPLSYVVVSIGKKDVATVGWHGEERGVTGPARIKFKFVCKPDSGIFRDLNSSLKRVV
jgi:hypothetical protein